VKRISFCQAPIGDNLVLIPEIDIFRAAEAAPTKPD
jgi:hypothetical protein